MESAHVKIFDTTLRDGQQCPGAGMSFENNIRFALLAAELGIDILEAGFPSASAVDYSIVETIARDVAPRPNSPIIAGLCQLREEQVDRTIRALEAAVPHRKARLHTYLPVAPELMVASLGGRAEDKAQLLRDIYAFVKKGCAAGLEVEFSPEGYSGMGDNFDFVTDCIRAAVEAGATTINCPDTIGGASRFQGRGYFVEKMKQHAGIIASEFPRAEVTWSTHCHNDFGLALENSLNAVFHGPARQIEGCINGIGERAGNVSLEQCIMVIKHFAADHDSVNPLYTKINTEKLGAISDFVSEYMLPRQPHWPITGDNAAKHSSGGHTNAILRNVKVYQPFDPEDVGKEVTFLFGPLSGGNHAKSIIESNGFVCGEDEKAEIAQFIKSFYEDRRKGITDKELLLGYFEYRKPIRVEAFDYSRTANRSEIVLTGELFGEKGEFRETYEGRDSALAALKQAIDARFPGSQIQSHKSVSEGEGIDAVSVSTIAILCSSGEVFEGRGRDRDIEISAMRALIDAVNRAYVSQRWRSEARA